MKLNLIFTLWSTYKYPYEGRRQQKCWHQAPTLTHIHTKHFLCQRRRWSSTAIPATATATAAASLDYKYTTAAAVVVGFRTCTATAEPAVVVAVLACLCAALPCSLLSSPLCWRDDYSICLWSIVLTDNVSLHVAAQNVDWKEVKIICCWSLLVLKLPIDFSFRLIKWSNILSTACLLCWMSAWHSDDDSQENLTRERDRKGFNNRGTWHCLHETATIWTLVRCWGKANVTFYIYLFKNKDSKSKCDTAFIMTIQFKSELSY